MSEQTLYIKIPKQDINEEADRFIDIIIDKKCSDENISNEDLQAVMNNKLDIPFDFSKYEDGEWSKTLPILSPG